MAILFVFAVGFALFFHAFLLSGFDLVFGDKGDTRILVAILEHWRHVFNGTSPDWRSPGFFYPTKNVLGYTDAYFLYALPYALFRASGVDMFLSFMLVLSLFSIMGFAGFYLVCRRMMGISLRWALVGAFLFAFPNMLYMKMEHAQTYCIMLAPILLLLGCIACKRKGWQAVAASAGAGIFLALMFFTAYLTAWFLCLFVLVWVLVGACRLGKGSLVTLKSLGRDHSRVLSAGLVGFFVAILPFLSTYVPLVLAGHARGYTESLMDASNLGDVLNIGKDNFIWGKTLDRMGFFSLIARPHSNECELWMGFTPIFLAIFLLALFYFRNQASREQPHSDIVSAWRMDQRDLLFITGISVVVCIALTWRMTQHISLWILPHFLIPGGAGVRAPFRIMPILNLFAVLVAMGFLSEIAKKSTLFWTILLGFLAIFLCLEQANLAAISQVSRKEEAAWLKRLSPPPASCQAFYLIPIPHVETPEWWVYQSDAMLAAVTLGIPTLNGNSSWQPKNWQLIDPHDVNYAAYVKQWITTHGLSGKTCGLSTPTGDWVEKPL